VTTPRPSRLRLVALWIGLTVVLATVLRTLPWRAAVQQLAHAQLGWLAAAAFANALVIVVWAAEWRQLAPGTASRSYAPFFDVVSAMAAVLNSVPFFAGEATGVALLIERAGLTRGAALSVLAMDQLLSGLSKLALLGVAALVVPLPSWLRAGLLALVAGVALLFAILVSMAHQWQRVHERLVARSTLLRRSLARVVALGAHLDAIRETHRARRVVALTVTKKLVELGAVLAVQMAFGLEPSLGAALLVMACIGVATLAPIAPGNIGVYEAAVFAAYRYVGVEADTALGLAVAQHLCFLLPMLGTGYLTLSLRQFVLRPRER